LLVASGQGLWFRRFASSRLTGSHKMPCPLPREVIEMVRSCCSFVVYRLSFPSSSQA